MGLGARIREFRSPAILVGWLLHVGFEFFSERASVRAINVRGACCVRSAGARGDCFLEVLNGFDDEIAAAQNLSSAHLATPPIRSQQ